MAPRENGNLLYMRYLFHTRCQEEDESIGSYAASLRELSQECRYKADEILVNEILRDRLIAGLRDAAVQLDLIKCDDSLSVEEVVDVVNKLETKAGFEQERSPSPEFSPPTALPPCVVKIEAFSGDDDYRDFDWNPEDEEEKKPLAKKARPKATKRASPKKPKVEKDESSAGPPKEKKKKKKRIRKPTPIKKETEEEWEAGKQLCPFCGDSFRKVEQHILYKHTEKKDYSCPHCDYKHALDKGMKAHIKLCHPEEGDYKVCHLCGYKTTTNQNMKLHISSVHEKQRPWSCDTCHKSFSKKLNRDRHVKVVHKGWIPYKCQECDKTFKWETSYRDHHRVVHLQHPFKCTVCEATFAQRRSVRTHMRSFHGLSAPSACTQCDQAFENVAVLRKHIKVTHSRVVSATPSTRNEQN